MYASERQQAIAAQVRARGRVSVTELAERFAVTGETVRRDLGILQRAGSLVRVHGADRIEPFGGAEPCFGVRKISSPVRRS